MKFYSYEYVLSQIGQQNSVMIGFGVFLLAITGFLLLRLTATIEEPSFASW